MSLFSSTIPEPAKPYQPKADDYLTSEESVSDVANQCLQSMLRSGSEDTPEVLVKRACDLAWALAREIDRRDPD